jgi:hypothetical protein
MQDRIISHDPLADAGGTPHNPLAEAGGTPHNPLKDAGGTPGTGLVADYSTLVDRRLDLLDRRTSLLEDAWRTVQSPSWPAIFHAIRKKIIS